MFSQMKVKNPFILEVSFIYYLIFCVEYIQKISLQLPPCAPRGEHFFSDYLTSC